jgi:crotonobetainyl-CoA:carnitine CoA-transferase CaiB-like acyl-CoA transferase
MGMPDVAGGGKWGHISGRERDRADVDRTVGEWTAQFTRDEVLARCEQFQVPCGPVYGVDEIFEDPQYAARENIKYMQDERIGELAIPNVVPRLSATPGGVDWLGPDLGQHNDDVYRGLLGLGTEQLATLREEGAI